MSPSGWGIVKALASRLRIPVPSTTFRAASRTNADGLALPSVENLYPAAAIKSSNACCFCQPSLPSKAIRPRVRTTTRNVPKANVTIKPSSPWHDVDQTSCSPCSETAHSMNLDHPNLFQQLDENYRSTSLLSSRVYPLGQSCLTSILLSLI